MATFSGITIANVAPSYIIVLDWTPRMTALVRRHNMLSSTSTLILTKYIACTLGITIVGLALPDPISTATFVVAFLTALGTGLGAGYAAFIKQRISVMREYEREYGQTLQSKIDLMTAEHSECMRKHASLIYQVDDLNRKFMDQQRTTEAYRVEALEYARTLMEFAGYILPPHK